MKKNVIAILLAGMLLALTACASKAPAADTASGQYRDRHRPGRDPADATENTEDPGADDGKVYTVGICQLVQHEALDAATQGFKDALTEALGDKVVFEEQNASNDIPTCGTICAGFAASNVDLILANATPALQAAVLATQTIPILGTAVTEYGVALDIDDFSGTVGGNVSGTSDLAPLDQQAQMLLELVPKPRSSASCTARRAELRLPGGRCEGCAGRSRRHRQCLHVCRLNDVATVTATPFNKGDPPSTLTDNTAASSTDPPKDCRS